MNFTLLGHRFAEEHELRRGRQGRCKEADGDQERNQNQGEEKEKTRHSFLSVMVFQPGKVVFPFTAWFHYYHAITSGMHETEEASTSHLQ